METSKIGTGTGMKLTKYLISGKFPYFKTLTKAFCCLQQINTFIFFLLLKTYEIV
jgi:hypothetical protein